MNTLHSLLALNLLVESWNIDWFQAGKGPDPVKLKLDQDMDEYFKAKPAVVEATTAATVWVSTSFYYRYI